MEQYIPKSALVAEIERRIENLYPKEGQGMVITNILKDHYEDLLSFIDTIEVKEIAPIAYVVTRCEEHSDYVEEVFFNEDKAQEYCGHFKGNENEYARQITKVKVTL